MDKMLDKLTQNVIEAEGRLDYSATEFETKLNNEVLTKAIEFRNAYIHYKKKEYDYNKELDARNNIYHVIEQLGKGRDNG